MLNLMNAKRIIVELAGEPVEMDPTRIREYRRELDFPTGNQSADKDPRGGTHLPQHCFELLSSGRDGDTFYAIQRTQRSGLSVACAMTHFVSTEAESAYSLEDGYQELCYSFHNTVERQEVKLESYGYCVEGDDALQQGLQFNSFHLLQSAGRDGLRHVAAKGLTGEGYEGHYFWDTEIYVIPAFLYSNPEICRALLKYRFHSLSAARQRAREMGHPVGALFPLR